MDVKINFEFGAKVKDKITSFVGTVTGYATYITGCSQYLIIPMAEKQTECPKGEWLDEDRLELYDSEMFAVPTFPKTTNGACGIPPIK